LIVTAHFPLFDRDRGAYTRISIETFLLMADLIGLLKEPPFELTTIPIGPGVIGQSATLVAADEEQQWLLTRRRVKLKPCEGRAIRQLNAAGYPIDPDHVRTAYQMPHRWTPADTMNNVRPGVFLGKVDPEDKPFLAVGFCGPIPIKVDGLNWANWLVIDVGRLRSID
jgi:hypothetical protein